MTSQSRSDGFNFLSLFLVSICFQRRHVNPNTNRNPSTIVTTITLVIFLGVFMASLLSLPLWLPPPQLPNSSPVLILQAQHGWAVCVARFTPRRVCTLLWSSLMPDSLEPQHMNLDIGISVAN